MGSDVKSKDELLIEESKTLELQDNFAMKEVVSYLTEKEKGGHKEVSHGGIDQEGAIELCKSGNFARPGSGCAAKFVKLC